MKTRRIIWFFVAAMCAVLVRPVASQETLPAPYEDGTVVVAVPAYFPPYYQTGPLGGPTGSAIDVMDALADDLDVTVRYRVYDTWQEVQDAVKTGRAHLIPNIGDTEERRSFFRFTQPLEQFQVSLFIPPGNIRAFEAASQEKWAVATTYTNVARDILERRGEYDVRLFDAAKPAIEAVLNGDVFGVALPEPVVFEYIREYDVGHDLIPVGEPLSVVSRGVAVGIEHERLFHDLNQAVTAFVKTTEYDQIFRKWHSDDQYSWSTSAITGLTLAFMVAIFGLIWLLFYIRARNHLRKTADAFLADATLERSLRSRIMIMGGVMMMSIALSVFAILYLHYLIHVEQIRKTIQETAVSQASLIEMLSTLPLGITGTVRGDRLHDLIVSRIRSAKTTTQGMGEFVLGRRVGDNIQFVLRQRHWSPFTETQIPLDDGRAIPMRMALLERSSGTVIGPDYRGKKTLAAYDYIQALDMGIVYKIDLDELQTPYFLMAAYGSAFAFLISLGGLALYFRIMMPHLREIQVKERQFRAIMDNAPAIIFISRPDGTPIEVNQAYCDVFDQTRGEILDHPKSAHMTDGMGEKFEEQNQAIVETGRSLDFEDHLTIDGRDRFFLTKKFPITSATGEVFAIGGIAVDLTEQRAAERALIRSEERFRAVFEQAAVGIAITDLDGGWLRVNEALSTITGYTTDELSRKSIWEITHPDDVAISRQNFTALVNEEVPAYTYEKRYFRKNGEITWVEVTASLVHDEVNEPEYVLAIIKDINARIHTQEDLKRTNRALRTISRCNEVLVRSRNEKQLLNDICRVVVDDGGFALAWAAFIRQDPQTDRWTFVPVSHYGIGEAAIDDCTRRIQSLNVQHKSKPTIIADMADTLCADANGTGSTQCLCDKFGLKSLCLLPLLNDGEPYGGLFIASHDDTSFDDSEIHMLSELANDLAYGISSLRSERNRESAEHDLRISEGRARMIIDSAHDAIVSIDRDDRITQFNPAAEAMFGYTRDEAVGHTVGDMIVPKRLRDHYRGGMRQCVDNGESRLLGQSIEMHGLHKDGTEFPVEITLSPLTGSQDDVCTAIIRDTTDRQQAELHRRQAHNMESLGNIASGMAHDVNNMLLPIINLTTMVRRGLGADSGEAKKLDMVLQAAERVQGLVQTILKFSHQETPEFKDQNLKSVISGALQLVRQTTPSSIEIVESLDACDQAVHVDEGQITAVLINLFSNASDAIGGHVGRIEITCRPFRPDKADLLRNAHFHNIDYAKVSVVDDGEGIEPNIMERIFDPFFTTKEPGKGTGLGMSIIQSIITQHNGAVDIHSKPGKGTRVDIYIPLAENETDETGEVP